MVDVDALRSMAREVVDAHRGEVKTHREGCYVQHAECLALWVLELTSDEAEPAEPTRT